MTRQIVQLDEQDEIVCVWENTKQIAKELKPGHYLHYQCFNQAIKKGYKSHGYFWMYKADYDKGLRPTHDKPTRNTPVYAYKPLNPVPKKEFKEFNYLDHEMVFLGRFENAVMAGNKLKVSVSNIRNVLNGLKSIHKGYWFSYYPLKEEDEETAKRDRLDREYIEQRERRRF